MFLNNHENISEHWWNVFLHRWGINIYDLIEVRWAGVCADPWSDCMARSISALERAAEKQCTEHFLFTALLHSYRAKKATQCYGAEQAPLRSWYWERRAWALRSQRWWVVGAAVIMEQHPWATHNHPATARQPLYRERATCRGNM